MQTYLDQEDEEWLKMGENRGVRIHISSGINCLR